MTLTDALKEKAATAVKQTWLVILPASGSVKRFYGVLISASPGEDGVKLPFLVDDKVALAVDSRALILDQDSLEVGWHPREHLHEIHPAAVSWFSKNPDVFSLTTKSGIRPVD